MQVTRSDGFGKSAGSGLSGDDSSIAFFAAKSYGGMPELLRIVTSVIVPSRWIVNRIVTTPFMPVWISCGMLLYQLTRMRLTIDCAYSPQSYHCDSNESGPDSAKPFSPPCPPRSTPCWPVPREAILPTSLIALFQLIGLAALA